MASHWSSWFTLSNQKSENKLENMMAIKCITAHYLVFKSIAVSNVIKIMMTERSTFPYVVYMTCNVVQGNIAIYSLLLFTPK